MIRPARSPRTTQLAQSVFELFIALVTIISCIAYFVQPDLYRDAALASYGDWYTAWELMYGLGGVLVAVGLIKLSPRLEVAGLCLFTSAITINVIVILQVYGAAAIFSIPTFLGLVAASVIRAGYLVHLSQIYDPRG